MRSRPLNRSVGCSLALLGGMVGAILAMNLGRRSGLIADAGSPSPNLGEVRPEVATVLGLAIIATTLAGIAVVVMFLAKYAGPISRSPRPRIQPQVLLLSFLAYMVSFGLIGLVLRSVLALCRIPVDNASLVYAALSCAAMGGAFAVGLRSLRWLTDRTGEDMREIGLRSNRRGSSLTWGFGGFLAAVPLVGAMMLIYLLLWFMFFRHVVTPQNPVDRLLTGGSLTFWAGVMLAAVVAPIVEETGFRGMLYNALRGTMGVWPAAVVSGALFSIIHPTLPGGFLPILAFGMVLAILREATGSLYPCMVCHGLWNGALLLMYRLSQG